MTSQPPLSVPPPHLVDLRLAHEGFAKTLRVMRWVAISVLGVVLALCLLALLLIHFKAGLIVLVTLAVVIGVCVAVAVNREKRRHGPASRGPSSFGQVVTTAPGGQVWSAAYAVLAAEKFAPPRPTDPHTVVASRSMSLASWGETVTMRIQPTPDGAGLVSVWSRPVYPLQWADLGRNRRFANAVLNAIPGATPLT